MVAAKKTASRMAATATALRIHENLMRTTSLSSVFSTSSSGVWSPRSKIWAAGCCGVSTGCSVTGGTAFTTWAYAIKQLGVAHTSVFLALSPLMTALAAFLFGDETLSAIQWAGLAIGMAGIYLTQIVIKTKKNNDTERSLRDSTSA